MKEECVTNKLWIACLENWVVKQDEKLKELDDNLKRLDRDGLIDEENAEILNLKRKATSLQIDLKSMKTTNISKKTKVSLPKESTKSKTICKCDECDQTFSKTCDLEVHYEEHENKKKVYL